MTEVLQIITLACLSFAVLGFSVAAYWMHGASLNWRAVAAYRRDDIPEGDRLRARARRWTIGARDE